MRQSIIMLTAMIIFASIHLQALDTTAQCGARFSAIAAHLNPSNAHNLRLMQIEAELMILADQKAMARVDDRQVTLALLQASRRTFKRNPEAIKNLEAQREALRAQAQTVEARMKTLQTEREQITAALGQIGNIEISDRVQALTLKKELHEIIEDVQTRLREKETAELSLDLQFKQELGRFLLDPKTDLTAARFSQLQTSIETFKSRLATLLSTEQFLTRELAQN